MDGQQLLTYSPVLFIVYIFIKDVLPKIAPELTKAISKRSSTEDRLFKLLEQNAENSKQLAVALDRISHSQDGIGEVLHEIDQRLEVVEGHIIRKEAKCPS